MAPFNISTISMYDLFIAKTPREFHHWHYLSGEKGK